MKNNEFKIYLLSHTTYTRNNMGKKWNQQTTIALTFLTHIISGIGGVSSDDEYFRGYSLKYLVPNWNTHGIMVTNQFSHKMAFYCMKSQFSHGLL